jgi:hypothetical protein
MIASRPSSKYHSTCRQTADSTTNHKEAGGRRNCQSGIPPATSSTATALGDTFQLPSILCLRGIPPHRPAGIPSSMDRA